MDKADRATRLIMPRRQLFRVAAVVAVGLPFIAKAQSYPTRPVRLIVGFAPGSTTDILARLISSWLSQRLGQRFFVENRPGAGGNAGAEIMVRSPPDGYTLYMVPPAVATNPVLYSDLDFNFIHDATPIAGVVRVPNVLEVNPQVPVHTAPEFIAYAKANRLSFASSDIGTPSYLAGELFNKMTGADLQNVPYHGDGPAMVDLVAGHVLVAFGNIIVSMGHIRAGLLRPLAVTTMRRSNALPGIPSLSEFLPGYEASSWFGVAGPAGMPIDVVETLNREINAGLADPTVKAPLEDLGGVLLTGQPADFGRLIAEETEKWGEIMRETGIERKE